jgi:hypothetical protein
MDNSKGAVMKETIAKIAHMAFATVWLAMIAPFIIPAFLIVKVLGGDPFSMDGMGADFMFMVAIAIGIAVASGAFAIGYFL